MDEVKWAWVLLVAATLALLIRLAMWFLPAPGWRTAKVDHAVEVAAAATDIQRSVKSLQVSNLSDSVKAEPAPVPPPGRELATSVQPSPALAVAAPPPEEFHLRHTRWGMALEEVRAAELDEPLRENSYSLTYATTTLDLPCLLAYYFDQGRLARARLVFSDPLGLDLLPLNAAQAQRRFLYLREQLRSRYGEPVQKTVYLPRDVSGLTRTAAQQEELARQYDTEIAESEKRLQQQRETLERRFAKWSNPAEMVARGLAPYERDLKDLRAWKKDALDRAEASRKNIQQQRDADAAQPLIGMIQARWPYARERQNIELRLDCRASVPRLEIRYEATPFMVENGMQGDL